MPFHGIAAGAMHLQLPASPWDRTRHEGEGTWAAHLIDSLPLRSPSSTASATPPSASLFVAAGLALMTTFEQETRPVARNLLFFFHSISIKRSGELRLRCPLQHLQPSNLPSGNASTLSLGTVAPRDQRRGHHLSVPSSPCPHLQSF